MLYHCRSLSLVALVAGSLFWLLLKTMTIQAAPLVTNVEVPIQSGSQAPVAQPTPPQDAPTVGYPCGKKENPRPNALCLYGVVRQGGQPIIDAEVTVAIGDESKDGTTKVRKNDTIPTYALNLGKLNPHYLQTAIVTATLGNLSVRRELVLFWDWETHNQRFDIDLDIAPPVGTGLLFGQVIHYASGGPVAGAHITATDGRITVATTTNDSHEPKPGYQLDLSQIPVNQLVSVTAFYSGYIASKVISRTDAPQELHLVTGRPCDSTDNIPRQGTGRSLPDDSKTLPEEGCFWGKVLFNSSPRAGVEVRLTISNTTYLGTSSALPGEKDPRYAVAVPGIARDDSYQGVPMTLTAVYSGVAASEVLTVNLDTGGNQQIAEIRLADIGPLSDFPYQNPDAIGNMIQVNGELWWGTPYVGITRYNLATDTYTRYASLNGLPIATIYDIAAGRDHSIWVATDEGINHYIPDKNHWETFTNPVQLHRSFQIVVDNEGYLWLEHSQTGLGYYTYTASTGLSEIKAFTIITSVTDMATIGGYLWVSAFGGKGVTQYKIQRTPPELIPVRQFTTGNGLFSDTMSKIVIENSDRAWFSTIQYDDTLKKQVIGVSHFISGVSELKTYTTLLQLPCCAATLTSLGLGNDASLWMGISGSGISHYTYTDSTALILQEMFTTTHGLGGNTVDDIIVNHDGSIWFGTSGGVTHYSPSIPDKKWETLATRNLASQYINVMKEALNQTLWIGTGNGLSHYIPGKTREEDVWATFTPGNSGLAGNSIQDILIDPSGWLWLATNNGLNLYQPSATHKEDAWVTFTTTHGLPVNRVTAIALHDNDFWVGTPSGVALFTYIAGDPAANILPMLQYQQTFTIQHGLVDNRVNTIAISADNHIWFGTSSGVSHYHNGNWVTLTTTTTNGGLITNTITTIAIDNDATPWFGTIDGVSHYRPSTTSSTERWETFLRGKNLSTILVDGHKAIWFGYTSSYVDVQLMDCYSVVDRYTLGGNPVWENISTVSDTTGYCSNFTGSGVFALGADNTIWLSDGAGINKRQRPPQQSDLVIELIQPTITLQDAPVTYVFTVTNNGRRDALNSILKLGLTGAEFSSVEPSVEVDQSDKTRPVFFLPTVPATGTRQIVLKVITTLASSVTPGMPVTARAAISTSTPEAFLSNNSATVEDTVRDAFKADLHITVNAPPLLRPGKTEIYTLTLGNSGGLTATDVLLNITLPEGLTAVDPGQLQQPIAKVAPTLRNQVGQQIGIPVRVESTVNEDSVLAVNAAASYVFTKEGQRRDTLAQAETRTSLKQARTLFLVAPDRMKGIYVTELMNKLHALAKRKDVEGMVIDVLRDETVRQAYVVWSANPGSSVVANDVAQAIKTNLIDRYTKDLRNLPYLVFVGDDEVIPFYRASDRSNSEWPEHSYASESLPNGISVRTALLDDILLTDDFYADRTSTSILINSQPYTLFVPDFASGRLVETPEQIMVALDTFIRSNGILNLVQHPTALVGMDKELTADLGEQIHSAVRNEGLQSIYTTSTRAASDTLISPLPGLVVNAQHSNHASLGEWPVENISGLPDNAADQRLLLLFGCHAGLNVSAPAEVDKRLTDLDLAEAWLSKGGVVIGSKAYAYASRHEMAYSEIFAEQFLNRLLTGTVQLLGPTLIQAKQEYFATRQASSYFDPLDTKVLLPMTLYGLPMWQVQTPQTNSSTPEPTVMAQSFTDGLLASSPITSIMRPLGASLVMTTVQGEGQYYALRYQGRDHTSVRKGYPMQPAYSFNLPATDDGRVAHGVVLRSVTYDEQQSFDPVIADIWVLDGEPPTTFLEPAMEFTSWDHEHFYSFGAFIPLTAAVDSRSQAKLNLILGNYHRETQTERLFDDFTFEVLYSSATLTDFTAPVIMTPTAVNITGTGITNQVIINVQATDTDSAIVAAVGVCDNGRAYHAMTMIDNGASWSGVCQPDIKRFYVQVIDAAGNVAPSIWITKPELITLVPAAYLPVVPKDYTPPLPDLIVSKIVATEQNITVAIRNIGAATVVDDFWVDACFDPEPIPTKVNQICKGLSFQYVMWAYLASQQPIAPGQTVTLTVGDTYYTPTHSIFTPTFTIGTPVYAHVDAAHKFTTYGGVLETHERAGGGYNNILSSTVVAGPVEQVLLVTQTDQSLERAQPASNLPPLPDVSLTPATEGILSTGLPTDPVVDWPLTPVITQTLALSNTESLSTTGQMQFIWLPILLK